MAKILHFECSRCKAHLSPESPQNVCPQCAGSLYVRYDLTPLRGLAHRDEISRAPSTQPWAGMWRYKSVLPDAVPVSLGEGWTPMLRSRRHPNALLKEEGANPTGSFKARGMAMAVTMARHYGLKKLAAPSAGNAAGALAAYAAAAGIEAHIFMPKDVPFANYVEAVLYGANVTLVDGLISDCGRIVAERKDNEGWFDVSTLKEPFRVEGKKTMGYELVEQLGWEYPDAVFYPTGGGVGLIGMWKAFEETGGTGLGATGKASAHDCGAIGRVRAGGACVRAARKGERDVERRGHVCRRIARAEALRRLHHDGYSARIGWRCRWRFPTNRFSLHCKDWAQNEGVFLCPEGAAATAAYDHLLDTGFLKPEDRVVLFNTGSGLKYTDITAEAAGIRRPRWRCKSALGSVEILRRERRSSGWHRCVFSVAGGLTAGRGKLDTN